jgi:M6 family metalloprotease-like protein
MRLGLARVAVVAAELRDAAGPSLGLVTRLARSFAVGLTLIAALPTVASAQDIEAVAELRGIPLPAGYYRVIRENPDFFEFQRALFARVGARLDAVGPALSTRATPMADLSGPVGSTAAAFRATAARITRPEGQVRLPVVLALFADSPTDAHISREMVQASLFDGPAERGTITEAYLEMSRGVLEVGGDVLGWVRTSLTMAEVVGSSRGLGTDARVGQYLVDALDAIDASVDFALYDNDGPDGIANSGDDDGFVDVITFEYLEVSASCGGPAIWPHRSALVSQTGAAYATDDAGVDGEPIHVQDYITQSAADCTGAQVQDAGTITHEFGHALGLPDWYHWIDSSLGPFGRRWVLGCWALMAAGSWGCGPVEDERAPFGPTHMIGYSKAWLGWVDYREVGEVWNQEIILESMETTGRPLRLPLDEAGTELLIAEYRTLHGLDVHLPGAGVLFYRNDQNASIRPSPDSGDPYFLSMLERDANDGLLRMAAQGGNRGEIGDAWGADGVDARLNGATTPSLRLANGEPSSVMVHEVHLEGDQARLVISTGRTPRLVPPAAPFEVTRIRTFAAPLRIAGGRAPYTGVGTLPEGTSLTTFGDELFLVGSVRDEGPHSYDVRVRDGSGNESEPVTITIAAPLEWTIETTDLLRGFLQLDGEPLTPGELDYLDDVGNANGTYDVGDLRRWLREGSS